MTRDWLDKSEQRRWGGSVLAAFIVHLVAGMLVIGWQVRTSPDLPEPVMVVELPPEITASPAQQPELQAETQAIQPAIEPLPLVTPRIEIPPAKVPAVHDPVVIPQPQLAPSPRTSASVDTPVVNPVHAASTGVMASNSETQGADPKAKKQETDYYALLSAHLNRKKSYPSEAKKARQQGIVAVRFTVDRSGQVSQISIKRSSGHALLDQATLDLMRRVSPLPAFPALMKQASATITVPIEYSLRTS